MKYSKKYAIKICILSFILSMVGMFVLYFFFPKMFCNYVYDVHTNYSGDEEYKPEESHKEYQEIFIPTYNYIKNINVYILCNEQTVNQNVFVCLVNEKGNTIRQETFTISSNNNIYDLVFEVEKWVSPEERYKLVLSMESTENMYVPLGLYDNKTPEHVELLADNESVESNLYLQYVYGTYSKKRLILWFIAFYISAFFIVDSCARITKEKKDNNMS